MRPHIAAVFATMNRREVAETCLRRLLDQTRRPERVLIADNVSQDGTAERLEEVGGVAPGVVEVIRMPENLGSAGGVETAMEHAFAEGADAVWILDDDSWPRPDALEAMLVGAWDPMVVLHPLQVDPETKQLTWPLQVVEEDGSVRLVEGPAGMPDGERVRSRGVWTGALVSKAVREAVGPVNGELFIRGEDEEYPWRIEQAGFRSEAVTAAVMDHPGPGGLVRWELFGRRLFLEPGLADWKLYYKVRNMVWLKRRQAGTPAAVMMALAYAAGISRIDGLQRLAIWYRAAMDGWRGKLGRKDF